MKNPLLATGCLAFLAIAPSAFADPATEVKDALRNFLNLPNYSWSNGSGTQSAAELSIIGGALGVKGQHEKDGYSVIQLMTGPHFGRDVSPTRPQAGITDDREYFSGRWVFEIAGGRWVALQDLPIPRMPGAPVPPPGASVNRSFASRRPDHEVAIILENLATVEPVWNGIYRAELTPDGAASLIVTRMPSASPIPPIRAEGASAVARLWVKDGMLVRYEIDIAGTRVAPNDRRSAVSFTLIRELTQLGTTVVDVPPEVRKMLRR